MSFWWIFGVVYLIVLIGFMWLWLSWTRVGRGIHTKKQFEEYQQSDMAEEAEHWRRESEKRNGKG